MNRKIAKIVFTSESLCIFTYFYQNQIWLGIWIFLLLIIEILILRKFKIDRIQVPNESSSFTKHKELLRNWWDVEFKGLYVRFLIHYVVHNPIVTINDYIYLFGNWHKWPSKVSSRQQIPCQCKQRTIDKSYFASGIFRHLWSSCNVILLTSGSIRYNRNYCKSPPHYFYLGTK